MASSLSFYSIVFLQYALLTKPIQAWQKKDKIWPRVDLGDKFHGLILIQMASLYHTGASHVMPTWGGEELGSQLESGQQAAQMACGTWKPTEGGPVPYSTIILEFPLKFLWDVNSNVSSQLILQTTQYDGHCYYSHLTDEEAETQRGRIDFYVRRMEEIDGQKKCREKKIWKDRQGRNRRGASSRGESWNKSLGIADTSMLNQLKIILKLL